MTTRTDDRKDRPATAAPQRDAEIVQMPRCSRCNLTYLPSKSTSALKLTYCSFLCELGDLGFSMSGLESMERVRKPAEDDAPAEPVAVE